jgi:hypothetical protein
MSSPADPTSPGWEAGLPPDKLESYKACNPVHNEPMTRVLQGLVNSTAEALRNTWSKVRAIRLGGSGATALATVLGSDTIYERKVFPRLVNRICYMSRRVFLKGNPGTGASAFQFYMLARFLNPALFYGDDNQLQEPVYKSKTVFAVPPRVVVRQLLGRPTEVWFMKHQVVHSITDKPIYEVFRCFDPLTTVYFFEPMGVKDVEPYATDDELGPTTLATVPYVDKGSYKHLLTVASFVDMPVWTEDELLAVGRDMKLRPAFDADMEPFYTDDAIRDRFKTYNGIISHVLPHTVAALEEVQRASGPHLRISHQVVQPDQYADILKCNGFGIHCKEIGGPTIDVVFADAAAVGITVGKAIQKLPDMVILQIDGKAYQYINDILLESEYVMELHEELEMQKEKSTEEMAKAAKEIENLRKQVGQGTSATLVAELNDVKMKLKEEMNETAYQRDKIKRHGNLLKELQREIADLRQESGSKRK